MNINSLEQALYALEQELFAEGKKKSGGYLLVNGERLRGLLDELYRLLPAALLEANKIVREKDDIVQDAINEANGIVADAQQRAEAMLDRRAVENNAHNISADIVSRAEQHAAYIVATAEQQARDTQAKQTEQIQSTLNTAALSLEKALQEIRTTRLY